MTEQAFINLKDAVGEIVQVREPEIKHLHMDDSRYIGGGDNYAHYQGYRGADRANYSHWKGQGRGSNQPYHNGGQRWNGGG